MNDATTSGHVSPELLKVAERAKRHPEQRILALAHLIDEPALERAYRSLRRDAAVGVDGVTVEQFVEAEFERVKHQRGLLRSALGYCVRQKDALMRFLEDGRLEMTNNHSERQLRKVACGRKVWLFVGSDDHGQAAGNLLTLIASARLHKLDPELYLRDIFRVLPHWQRQRYLELAPRYWQTTRARLDPKELDQEIGPLTIPEPALSTASPAAIPAELRAAP
jgi:transposase